jgi:hypothetical protein
MSETNTLMLGGSCATGLLPAMEVKARTGSLCDIELERLCKWWGGRSSAVPEEGESLVWNALIASSGTGFPRGRNPNGCSSANQGCGLQPHPTCITGYFFSPEMHFSHTQERTCALLDIISGLAILLSMFRTPLKEFIPTIKGAAERYREQAPN